VVLMGLDAGVFPRPGGRPGFHLMERRRRLGDPQPSDQDRYVLLEALLSARSRLLITWKSRDDRHGEALQPATPVRQWLDWLAAALGPGAADLLVEHPASPLERANFQPRHGRPPASCDRRQLAARRLLDLPQTRGQPPLQRRPMPPHAAAAADAEPPGPVEDPFADLRAWLMEPQRHWLAGLGLRPAEWDRSLEDLEPLSLGERERAALLRAIEGDPQAPRAEEDWLHSCRGQGLLPPRNAAALEARRLEQRRRSLEEQALALGSPWSGDLAWGPWRASQRWQGGAVLVLHLGKADAPHHLDLWLQLLLACAAAPDPGRAPGRGVLLARDSGDRFSTLTLQAPDPGWAREELTRLGALRERWRLSCSPVPPRTGWSWWERERGRTGSGLEVARQRWEGDPQRPGERMRPEMVACFGGDLPVAELLSGAFAELAADLFEAPLAAADQDGARPSPRRRGGG